MCEGNTMILSGATFCDTCPDGSYLTGTHCGDCLSGYWANPANNHCELCNNSCKECAGPGEC